MKFIILTSSQAQKVAYTNSEKLTGLNPVRIKTGSYILSERVLADEAHSLHHAFLKSLPIREIDKEEI